MFVYLVRKFSVEELVSRIKQRSVITKASVLSESKDPRISLSREFS